MIQIYFKLMMNLMRIKQRITDCRLGANTIPGIEGSEAKWGMITMVPWHYRYPFLRLYKGTCGKHRVAPPARRNHLIHVLV